MGNIRWDDRARKELRSLDTPVQNKILKYLRSWSLMTPIVLGVN